MTSNSIRIVVIEDHTLTRLGILVALRGVGIDVVAEAIDAENGFKAVMAERPNVAVIDILLPGQSGLVLTREIKEKIPHVGIVILSMADGDRDVRSALAAGADAYCVKTSDPPVLIEAIRTVAAGGAYFDPQIARVALDGLIKKVPEAEEIANILTIREREVLSCIAQGTSNGEIAQKLGLSLGTVKGDIANILDTLAASDRAQAAVIAFRLGLIT